MIGCVMSNIFTGNVLILLQEKMLRRGNQNPYIKEEQTTQRSKVKGQTTIYKTYT